MGQEAVGYLIKRLDEAFKQAMDEALAPHGLSRSTYTALHRLHYFGAMTTCDVATANSVAPQTMYRLVKSLRERGHVHTHATRGRSALLGLTPVGTAAFLKARRDVGVLETRMSNALSREQTETLRGLLQTCQQSLVG